MTSKFRHAMALVFVWPAAAHAQTAIQDLDMLENRVIAALGAGIGEPGGPMAPIDRRMKLAACPANVIIDPPALGALGLRCPQIGWRIRVPLTRIGSGSAFSGPVTANIAPVIKRGDPVEIYTDASAFRVSTQAVAQEDGAIGSRIRVRTDAKAANIIAEVVDMGVVRLAGFK